MISRIIWIDVLKGILLILICLSHFGTLPPYLGWFIKPTGSIWVPCFFMLSGILFSGEKYPTFYSYVRKKIKTLLLPYCFFSIVFLLLDWNLFLNPKNFWPEEIRAIIVGSGAPKAAPLWFVLALFWASIFYYILYKFFPNKILRLTILGMISFSGYLLHYLSIRLPLQLDVALGATVLLGTGHIIAPFILRKSYRNKYLYLILFSISGEVIGFINNPGMLNQNNIINYGYFYLTSICGSLAIILLFQYLKIDQVSKNIIVRFTTWVSKNGIIILACHCYLLICYSFLAGKLNLTHYPLIDFVFKVLIVFGVLYLLAVPLVNSKFYRCIGKNKYHGALIIKYKMNYSILINTCDKFEDCWDPFFKLWSVYWKDCKGKIYLNTDYKDYSYPGIHIIPVKGCEKHCFPKNKRATWSQCFLWALEAIDTEIILYMQEDYFLKDIVKNDLVEEYVRLMARHSHIKCIHLTDQAVKASENSSYWKLDKVPFKQRYRVSCQAALWRKQELLDLLRKQENAWEFEEFGSQRSAVLKQDYYMVSRDWVKIDRFEIIPYLFTGIIQGKWYEKVVPLFQKHNIEIDYSERGFVTLSAPKPLKARIRYRLNKILKILQNQKELIRLKMNK